MNFKEYWGYLSLNKMKKSKKKNALEGNIFFSPALSPEFQGFFDPKPFKITLANYYAGEKPRGRPLHSTENIPKGRSRGYFPLLNWPLYESRVHILDK